MSLIFYLHDREFLLDRVTPILRECWKKKSFAPGQAFFAELTDHWPEFRDLHHFNQGTPLFAAMNHLPCDAFFWSSLVGEILLYTALEIPYLEVDSELLLATNGEPMKEVLFGSRPIQMGRIYRRDQAGWSLPEDLTRFATFLNEVHPEDWHLPSEFRSDLSEEDREDDLEMSREWYPNLREMVLKAAEKQQILVSEWLD